MAKTATYDGSAAGGPRASTAGDDARNINTRGTHIAPAEIAIGVVVAGLAPLAKIRSS